MNTTVSRLYNCKDEELVPISRFVLFSLKRDQVDFFSYSANFKPEYVTALEAKITEVSDLMEPASELLARKLITDRLYTTMTGLITPINRLSGYVTLAQKTLGVTPADFGITGLRKSITNGDAEGVAKNLHLIISNITTYKVMLMQQGLTEDLMNELSASATSIAADKQQQYEITISRKNIIQNNAALLNGLYEQMSEIMTIGKILYKNTDKVKLSEYTFADLLKKVRVVSKKDDTKPVETVSATNN
jgi:hypothetical protein